MTLGFYAVGESHPLPDLETACREFVAGFDGDFIEAGSVKFLGGATRSVVRASLQAQVVGSRSRRGLSRVAHALAARLARL